VGQKGKFKSKFKPGLAGNGGRATIAHKRTGEAMKRKGPLPCKLGLKGAAALLRKNWC